MKTTTFVNSRNVSREWVVVDAAGMVLGRLASEVARRLRGKHKAIYAPHVDTGDHVVVVNAEKVRVTGDKERAKHYHRHSGHPGGLRTTDLRTLRARHPTRIIESAVRGMLPKTPLGRAMFRKLHVYAGPEHQHAAQQPKPLALEN